MILNPTHEITLSGLPPEVLNAYVRYKKGSRAIVSWMVQFGPSKYQGRRTLPIKELTALARKVAVHIKHLPDVIHFHFKETIAARRCLSRYFRENRDQSQEEVDTVNHEHFTDSLSQIYNELCEQCLKSKNKVPARRKQNHQIDLSATIRNHYECLPVEDTSMVEDALTDLSVECSKCVDDIPMSCPGTASELQFQGDELTSAIETIVLLRRAQKLYECTSVCWQQAGRSDTSFIAAAAATNAAWTLLRDVETQLISIHGVIDLTKIHQTCYLFKDHMHDDSGKAPQPGRHALLHAWEESQRSLRHYVDGHKLNTISTCASCVQKPSDYVQPPCESASASDTKFQIALLDNMLHLINKAGHGPALTLHGTPCLAEVGYLMTHLDDKPDMFQCTMILHLLTTSYRAYLSACAKPASVSMCRISALKMASQASSAVVRLLGDKTAFPCQCPQTLAFHLANLQRDLEFYTKYKCWDLYFQSPWIAGTHIIEMLDVLSYYGMRLFHYRHYVGAILHTYNVVQRLGGLESISVLDEICSTFKDVIFPAGDRPKSAFKNSWSRFVGARLRFKRGHRGQNQRESWCMAVPAHAQRAAAGFGTNTSKDKEEPRFNYGKIDPLMKLKQQCFRPNETYTDDECIHDGDDSITASPTRRSSSSSTPSLSWSASDGTRSRSGSDISLSSGHSTSPSNSDSVQPLASLTAEIESTLTFDSSSKSKSLPTSRLNLLAIFTTCLTLTARISDRIHSSASEKDTKNCICFATTLLTAADRIVEGRKVGRLESWRKDEREVVEIVKEVIREVLLGDGGVEKNREEWLWQV